MFFEEEKRAVLVWSMDGVEMFFSPVDNLTIEEYNEYCRVWGTPKGKVRKDHYIKSYWN